MLKYFVLILCAITLVKACSRSDDASIRAGGSVFRGGLKITRPKCIHLFSGGGPGVSRCILRVPGVSRGMTGVSRCIFFFQRTKKSQVYLLGVARCISRFSGGGLATPRRFRGGLATPRRFQAYLGLNYC